MYDDIGNEYDSYTPISDLIANGNSLSQILEAPNLISELRGGSHETATFLLQDNIFKELISLLLKDIDPNQTTDENYKLPHVSCEILSSSSSAIVNKIRSSGSLDQLLDFLEQEGQITPICSFRVSKVLLNFLQLDRDYLLALMNERHSLVNLIKHLDCYPFCEFISSVLFTIDNVSLKSDLLTLIKSDNFVTNILKQLHCSTNPIESSSIYQILSHIIAIFSNVDLPEIVSQLFLQTDRDLIISILFEGASNHAKIAVLSLLIDIVWNLRYFSHDDAFDPIDEDVQPPEFIEAFILPNLTRFSTLLKGMTSPSVFSSVDCFNRKGMIKLRLIILFSSVIRSGYGHSVDSALISSQIFPTLVELFFSPSNNNILHTELYTIFEQGLISRSDDLCEHIVLDSGLATRVKDSLHKEQERLTQLLTQPSYSTSPLIATCSIDSNDPVPSPSPPLLSKTPIKVDDVPPYLAHTLHIARILQDKAVYVNGLLEILDAEWDELFSVIVKPQMDAQESPPLPITDEMAQQVSMNQTPIQLDWNNGSSDQYDDDFVM